LLLPSGIYCSKNANDVGILSTIFFATGTTALSACSAYVYGLNNSIAIFTYVFGASGNGRNARRDAATLAYACSVAGPGQLDEM